MPGAFNFTRDQGAPPRLSGAKSHIFQPPSTPSASSSLYLARSTTSSAMSYEHVSSNTGKKRSRTDYYKEQTPDSDAVVGDPGSPMPFVNTKYALAGGLDTPTLKAAEQYEASESVYSDIGYRRELSSDKPKGLFGEESSYQSFPFELDQESEDQQKTNTQQSNEGEAWTKTALGVVGEVVGKVWEFCKTSAFRGFHAGLGDKYTVNNTSATHFTIDIGEREKAWESEKVSTPWDFERESTPLPGRFPEEEFIPDYIDRPTLEGTPPRAAKRRQVGRNNEDEITKNWVVVPPTISTPSRPQSNGAARYSMPTTSSAGRRLTTNKPASRASPAGLGGNRRSMLPRGSHAGSPSLQSTHGASFASPRSPAASKIPRASPMRAGTTPVKVESPAAREAARWAALKKKEEREADQSLRRLDAQLKAMIREGKEALGTRIEVEIDADDDEFGQGGKKWAI
ncbi:hypothetical protein OIDMADRAFT_175017 [Oidiodendron maius Zn]|uniref:Uncharacterized protein n=1 Tax=Oidiodendron maius (strain Zn) TaxID=913774 RepID=A0A0C3HIY7_OIDMZ|nr:hypothetical protein OIDMADRAFT_175017 [Oidiodendron maius Zn]